MFSVRVGCTARILSDPERLHSITHRLNLPRLLTITCRVGVARDFAVSLGLGAALGRGTPMAVARPLALCALLVHLVRGSLAGEQNRSSTALGPKQARIPAPEKLQAEAMLKVLDSDGDKLISRAEVDTMVKRFKALGVKFEDE